VVALGGFGFKAGGGAASGSWIGPTAGLVGGADVFDRLWEMVPKLVDSLIKGAVMISERVERVEPPRGRDPDLEVIGKTPWPNSISCGAANDSSTGSGGRSCDRFASR